MIEFCVFIRIKFHYSGVCKSDDEVFRLVPL